MRILFTGGGTGGHFYPILAVASELNALIKEKRLLEAELYYMAPTPYNPGLLFENNLIFRKISAGKVRRYFSFHNFFDIFKTGFGILSAVKQVYSLYPDVVFGKGGYVSFPVLFAAKLLRIPVVIHESDTVPGRVNVWAGKFAVRIAISYPEAAKYFPEDKVALTGNPVRKDIQAPITEGASDYFGLEAGIPTVLILGGSQGASLINDAVIEGLSKLVEKFQVIHQAGPNNITEVKHTAEAVLFESRYKSRYKPYDYLNGIALRMAAGAADVVVSRAGSSLFEIATWKVPAIIIPITDSNGDHQRQNAFAFASAGAGQVIEEKNLTPNILASEIERLVTNKEAAEKMKEAQAKFYRPDAAKKIAEELLKIALSHEIEK